MIRCRDNDGPIITTYYLPVTYYLFLEFLMSFIAIDLGTTFIKGAVLDLDGLRLHHIQRLPFPDPLPNLPPLFYEVDPNAVVATVRALIADLLAHALDCEGIVMCTQMHGLVLCNEQGAALSNVITWQDQRVLTPHLAGAGSYFERLRDQLSAQERRQLGNELQPSRPLCFLYWLAQNSQLPPDAIPAGIPDFVIANLCNAVPRMELTSGAAHAALNLETLDWHQPMLDRLGLGDLRWPQLVAFGEVIATLAIEGKTLPFYTPVGDHQCALVGAFLGADELSLNISTGSQVSLLTEQRMLGDYQTRPFFDGRFLNTITGVPAGRALNHLVELLIELPRAQGLEVADPWHYIVEAAGRIHESDLDVNLAFFDSAGGQNGHITHIREDNLNVGHLFYAAFQNMAENYARSAQRLSAQPSWQRIVFSGGLAQKIPLLRTIIQRKFETKTRLCASTEDTLLGLLALALVASGRQPSVATAIQHLLVRYKPKLIPAAL
jgi:sugar (pentulose or hexulose) kinase